MSGPAEIQELQQHLPVWWEIYGRRERALKPCMFTAPGRWPETGEHLHPYPIHVAEVKLEVDGFYWTARAPDIVNSGREEQSSVSV